MIAAAPTSARVASAAVRSLQTVKVEVPADPSDNGHRWIQEMVSAAGRKDAAVLHHGRRYCRRCGKSPLQVLARGSNFRQCEREETV